MFRVKGTCRKQTLEVNNIQRLMRSQEKKRCYRLTENISKLHSLDSICDLEGGAWRTAGRRTLRCCSLGFWLGTPEIEPTCLILFKHSMMFCVYMFKLRCSISKKGAYKKGARLGSNSSLSFHFNKVGVWKTTQKMRSTSNTNLNLVPVHVWELVALNGIP